VLSFSRRHPAAYISGVVWFSIHDLDTTTVAGLPLAHRSRMVLREAIRDIDRERFFPALVFSLQIPPPYFNSTPRWTIITKYSLLPCCVVTSPPSFPCRAHVLLALWQMYISSLRASLLEANFTLADQ
jgi:hypothetical protein